MLTNINGRNRSCPPFSNVRYGFIESHHSCEFTIDSLGVHRKSSQRLGNRFGASRYTASSVRRYVVVVNKCTNMNLMARDSLRIDSRPQNMHFPPEITVLAANATRRGALSRPYRSPAIDANGCQSYRPLIS